MGINSSGYFHRFLKVFLPNLQVLQFRSQQLIKNAGHTSSPSRKVSVGMVLMISFRNGQFVSPSGVESLFQRIPKPLTPSYFSNIHLLKEQLNPFGFSFVLQFVGSIEVNVKNTPMKADHGPHVRIRLSKNFGGISGYRSRIAFTYQVKVLWSGFSNGCH